ncbi:MAG: caspase family protein [Cyanobacteria bacterium J06635_15]
MPRYALVIGIAQYDNFRELRKTATDAESIARILRKRGSYQIEPSPKKLIEAENRWCIAPDKNLTGQQLGQALQTFLLEKSTRKDALIYFAGHGFEAPSLTGETEGYLATSDSSKDGRNAVRFDDLNKLISKSDLSSLVVVLDCCYAGALLERSLLESNLTAFREKKDYYLITACRSFERAREGKEHGIFTEAVLRGLQIENADEQGQISGDRLFDFLARDLMQSGQEPLRIGVGRSLTLVNYPTQPKVKTEIDESICPYRGLKPFEKEHSAFFFGRRQVVENIWKKLDHGKFVAVVGASGSGKSSVVRAGLIPWLEQSGWQILDPIKPGDEPLTELRTAFKAIFQSSPKIQRQIGHLIRQGSNGLQPLIEQLPDTSKFLLVVDQFEETFTVCSNEEDRSRFIHLITQICQIPSSQLAVVITMRADFLELCLQYESLTHIIQTQTIFMPPLTGANLERAITKPAEVQNYQFEKDLLAEIRQDVGNRSGMLPLLQFALTELWERREREKHLLLCQHYENMGRVFGALNRHAEKVYHYSDYQEQVPKQAREELEQKWIRRIFLRLVRTNEGEKDTRQRKLRTTLIKIAGDKPEHQKYLDQMLTQLINAGLLVSAEGVQHVESSEAESLLTLAQTAKFIDLAHESLIDGWQRFAQDWLEESRQLRRLRDRLETAMREWVREDRREENLMMGGLLVQAQENWQDLALELDIEARDFYERSIDHDRKQKDVRQRADEVRKEDESVL